MPDVQDGTAVVLRINSQRFAKLACGGYVSYPLALFNSHNWHNRQYSCLG